jgi:hypothetical protein
VTCTLMLIKKQTVGVLKTNYELIYDMPIMFIYIGLALTQPMSIQRKPMARSYFFLFFWWVIFG